LVNYDTLLAEGKIQKLDERIMKEIEIKGTLGIAHCKLAKKLKIDRDTLRRHLKSLQNYGLVKRYGTRGNYYISPELSNDEIIEGNGLRSLFINKLLGSTSSVTFTSAYTSMMISTDKAKKTKSEETQMDYPERIVDKDTYLKFFNPQFNSFLERIIFEFVNQIGSYSIFVFLKTFENYHENDDIYRPLKSEGIEWLKAALNEKTIETYDKFLKSVLLHNLKDDQEKEVMKHIKKNSLYVTKSDKKKVITKEAFKKLYPVIYDQLQQFYKESKDEGSSKKDILLNLSQEESLSRRKEHLGKFI
jgi:DNA-binding Lrp family transcriptional regulator